jgi:hypothetical protein
MRQKISKAGEMGEQELYRILGIKNQTGTTKSRNSQDNHKNVIDSLNDMPLESLSQYVHAESLSLQGAKFDLEGKRRKGTHRIYAKTERFVTEFDRFLTAYSGIVNVLVSADSQYGGIATATLAMLFSVSLHSCVTISRLYCPMRRVPGYP